MSTPSSGPGPRGGLSRRGLVGGALAGAGLIGLGGGIAAAGGVGLTRPDAQDAAPFGGETIPCHGTHQAGVATPMTAHGRYLAFRLRSGVDAAAIARLLRVLTADIEALTAGRSPVTDTEPELAANPARLTVTVGFGQELVRRVAPGLVPAWLGPVRDFPRDALDPAYTGGDLLLAIAADDQMAVSHAARLLGKTVHSFTTPAWQQHGFRNARGGLGAGHTMRNLMGQVDGTTNPAPGTDDFAGLVWLGPEAGWLRHGTVLVIRRIRMEMDTWDTVDRVSREGAMGRDLAVGAPLTGSRERDAPDWEARDALGFHIIPDYAHIRRARSTDPAERVYRRPLNYDDGTERGLLFLCYQRDPRRQFEAIQARLDELDLMNEWVTHTGSAMFAIAPGWAAGGSLGDTLLAAAA